MINKKPLSSTTGTLAALGLGISSLYSAANAIEGSSPTDLINDAQQMHNRTQPEQPAKKVMEGLCGSAMRMDMEGMVMHENTDRLPKDCPEISEDISITVRAGTQYAEQYPGTVFGYDEHEWKAKPCSRITIEFINDDEIRHQWMIHRLPKYLYPQGMFHIEVNGQTKKTGTFIVPSSNFTYLVHCDISQHMEKGMKAQLKVGTGRGNLPSIPGISDPCFPEDIAQKSEDQSICKTK